MYLEGGCYEDMVSLFVVTGVGFNSRADVRRLSIPSFEHRVVGFILEVLVLPYHFVVFVEFGCY